MVPDAVVWALRTVQRQGDNDKKSEFYLPALIK